MPYWEDYEVGQTHRFGRYEVTREEIVDYAKRWDPQPFHLSDEGASNTPFGSLSASGWNTGGMAMAMIVAEWKSQGETMEGAVGVGIDNLRWLKPVRPGDVLRLETEVLEMRPSTSRPAMGMVRQQNTLFNQNDEAVMRWEPVTLYQRKNY